MALASCVCLEHFPVTACKELKGHYKAIQAPASQAPGTFNYKTMLPPGHATLPLHERARVGCPFSSQLHPPSFFSPFLVPFILPRQLPNPQEDKKK